MRLAVIGTGTVGTALARGFDAAAHDVVVGSRSPDGSTVAGVDAPVLDHGEALAGAEAVVLAVPADAAAAFARRFAADLDGVAVVDPTNEYPDATGGRAVAERIADAAPGAGVAKAFNTIGAEHMVDPAVGPGTASMLIAGDPTGVAVAGRLAADLGFDAVVAGDLATSRRLEDLGRLWIDLSLEHGRDVAFQLLRG